MGTFRSDSIRAWSVSTETGFTFYRLRLHPRPLLRADVYSGDGNPADHTAAFAKRVGKRSADCFLFVAMLDAEHLMR